MSRVRLSLISSVGTGLAVVLASSLGGPQAQAQFVCVGNSNGATVGPATASGDGATAAGSLTNFACGQNANASGTPSLNTAVGTNANASGNNQSSNLAVGVAASAQGDASSNIATGNGANASGSDVPSTPNNLFAANIATGFEANASGDGAGNVATGDQADASGLQGNNIASGLTRMPAAIAARTSQSAKAPARPRVQSVAAVRYRHQHAGRAGGWKVRVAYLHSVPR